MSKDWRHGLQGRMKDVEQKVADLSDGTVSSDHIVATDVTLEQILDAGPGIEIIANDAAVGSDENGNDIDLTPGQGDGAGDGGNINLNGGTAGGAGNGGDINITPGSSGTGDAGTVYISGARISMADLPTSDPQEAGLLWIDTGTLKVSTGGA